MTALSKGQNAPLPGPDVVVSVDLPAPADVSALLVTSAGKVRSDADFVFFNQPDGPGVSLRDGRLHVSTAHIPADIEAVRAVITLDDATRSFGQFTPPVTRITDPSGTPLFEYVVGDLSSESVVIAVEVYLRGGVWKVRAVGQGYAGGFADLVRDHGVSVDDEPPAPPAAPAPPVPPAPPAPQQYSPPAPQQPTYSAPPPQNYGAPPPPAAPPAAPEISLTKNRPVSLSKGQKVSLRKDGGVALTRIVMGLGWDPIQKKGMFGSSRTSSIDLDASVLMFSRGQCAEIVYFGHLTSNDRSIVHSGDNLTGEGDGDDEMVAVDLRSVPPHIDNLVFVVTSYRGQTFAEVQNAYCRLIDQTINSELARFTLAGGMPFTGVTMCVVHREGGDWKLRAIGEGFNGKTPKKAIEFVTPYLG